MPRVVDHDQRRAELARAGVELVRSQGVAALSVRNLATASGWSAGAVRHYLPTHADIVALVVNHVRDGFEARLLGVPPVADPIDQLRALLKTALPLDAESRELSQVWFAFLGAEMHTEHGAGALVFDELAEVFTAVFTRHHEAGTLRIADPRQAAAVLQAQLDGLTVHLLLGRVTRAQALAALDLVIDSLVVGDREAADR